MKRIDTNRMATEKRYRNLIKTISWKALVTSDKNLTSRIIAGNINFAESIGGIELFTSMFLYCSYERNGVQNKFGLVGETLDYCKSEY